jgi:hypothetical protein
VRRYPEIAQAIAYAANDDPLAPDDAWGSEATAAILIAYAWEKSRFDPHLVRGYRLGLFQIRPPIDPPVLANTLLLPRTAALVAVDLVRQSVDILHRRPWQERLAWALDLGSLDGPALARSRMLAATCEESALILSRARFLFERRLGKGDARLEHVVEPCTRALPGRAERTKEDDRSSP